MLNPYPKGADFTYRGESSSDILIELARQYATRARWQKALIHLREEGKIEEIPPKEELLKKQFEL